MLVLELIDQIYTEVGNFYGDDLVVSPQFTQLNLQVAQIFDAVNQA